MKSFRVVFFGYFLSPETSTKLKFWTSDIEKRDWISSALIIDNNGRISQYKEPSGKLSYEFFPSFFVFRHFELGMFFKGLKVAREMRQESQNLFDVVAEQEKLIATSQMRREKSLLWWFRLHSGLGVLSSLLDRIEVGESDVFVLWGQNLSVHRVLASWVRLAGAQVIYSEGTELQGSVFASESGILHRSWPMERDVEFRKLPFSEASLEASNGYLKRLSEERFSNKSYDGDAVAWDEIGASGEPVIYVNGLENFGSGLRPRCSSESKEVSPEFETNEALVREVLRLAEKHNWHVIYKDHPNTFSVAKELLVKIEDHPRLWILENVDIHEVMDKTDAMVSLCSKVVLLALSRGVPVVLGGAFSVAPENLEFGLIEDPKLETGLLKVLARGKEDRVDRKGLVELTARFVEHYAYRLQDAGWDSEKDQTTIWSDIGAYLNGEREVISTDALRSSEQSFES